MELPLVDGVMMSCVRTIKFVLCSFMRAIQRLRKTLRNAMAANSMQVMTHMASIPRTVISVIKRVHSALAAGLAPCYSM